MLPTRLGSRAGACANGNGDPILARALRWPMRNAASVTDTTASRPSSITCHSSLEMSRTPRPTIATGPANAPTNSHLRVAANAAPSRLRRAQYAMKPLTAIDAMAATAIPISTRYLLVQDLAGHTMWTCASGQVALRRFVLALPSYPP